MVRRILDWNVTKVSGGIRIFDESVSRAYTWQKWNVSSLLIIRGLDVASPVVGRPRREPRFVDIYALPAWWKWETS